MGFGRKVWNYGITNCNSATIVDRGSVDSKKAIERQIPILFVICNFTNISRAMIRLLQILMPTQYTDSYICNTEIIFTIANTLGQLLPFYIY